MSHDRIHSPAKAIAWVHRWCLIPPCGYTLEDTKVTQEFDHRFFDDQLHFCHDVEFQLHDGTAGYNHWVIYRVWEDGGIELREQKEITA